MKKLLSISLLMISFISVKSQINQYTKPLNQTLERYEQLDFTSLYNLAKANQDMEIARNKSDAESYRQFYKSHQYFKVSKNEFYLCTIIVDNVFKREAKIKVLNNKIISLETNKIFTSNNGLKITSEISKAYSKVFIDINNKLIPIEIYFPRLFSISPVYYKIKPSDFKIGVYDIPNFAVNKQISEISTHITLKYIKPAENGFFEIGYGDMIGYILDNKVIEL